MATNLRVFYLLPIVVLCCFTAALASVFGDIRGIARDPQGHVIPGAAVTLRSRTTDLKRSTQTNSSGEFTFRSVPIGEYTVTVSAKGFADAMSRITVISDLCADTDEEVHRVLVTKVFPRQARVLTLDEWCSASVD